METTTLTLHDGDRIINETITPGKTLLELIHNMHHVHVDAPCGGKGTCGKCKVTINEGKVTPPTEAELKFLSEEELECGVRLACLCKPEGNLTVSLGNSIHTALIKESGSFAYDGPVDSIIKNISLSLPPSNLEDQRSLESRVKDGLEASWRFSHDARRQLARLQKEESFDLTLRTCGDEITAVMEKADGATPYILAVDIGTTTVVGYLLNAETGTLAATASALNKQKSFGADVISRIDHIGNDPEKLALLQSRIVKQIEDLAASALKEAGLDGEDLSAVFAAGNTTMMHILQGLAPGTIAEAPFIPVSTESMILRPEDIGSSLPAHTRFVLLPSLSAYIGADIVAGILAAEMAESEALCLLIDIGTNGEIALGNKDRLISCSTAAGPAFEGANIQCGVGGIPGAVSSVKSDGPVLEMETIGGHDPCGICGSGIIDMTALMLKSGLADYTGRITDESDWGENPPELADKLENADDMPRFMLDGSSGKLFFSQKDLREVQLAKGSIAAGVHTLISESDASIDDIEHVFLAGGFGSYIDTESALEIGLIPPELKGKIRSVGNSCGAGVIRSALNKEELEKTEMIRNKTEYLELSSHQGFQNEYMMQMYFPETE